MAVGERWQIWSPPELARLDEDSVVGSPLVFVVDLIDFLEKPERPPDVSVPPRDAERTITGLAYRILRPGTGTDHPRFGDTVEVHYAGWTTDGEMFDSSFDHGRPGRFVLDSSKPNGWNEALTMMVVGEKRRVWIPEELAYAGAEDRPAGMLVFDLELLSLDRAE
jgi:peptidylprolyl isomerase